MLKTKKNLIVCSFVNKNYNITIYKKQSEMKMD